MTDLEIMRHAKDYMDKLSEGIDPISGTAVPTDSALNNPRLAKCFSYVSGVLQRVIENGGAVGEKPDFVLTPQTLSRLAPADRALRITEFAQFILDASDDPNTKRPNTKAMTDWLLQNGYLEKGETPDGKAHRVPTAAGRELGIFTETRQGQYGEYTAVYYNPDAQRFLIRHLPEIFAP